MAEKKNKPVLTVAEITEAGPGVADRLGCKELAYKEVKLQLRPLTYVEMVHCEGIKDRAEDDGGGIAAATALMLKLGIESASGTPWQLERLRVAGRKYDLPDDKSIDALPPVLSNAAAEQIGNLTNLSAGELDKLDFITPSATT